MSRILHLLHVERIVTRSILSGEPEDAIHIVEYFTVLVGQSIEGEGSGTDAGVGQVNGLGRVQRYRVIVVFVIILKIVGVKVINLVEC